MWIVDFKEKGKNEMTLEPVWNRLWNRLEIDFGTGLESTLEPAWNRLWNRVGIDSGTDLEPTLELVWN